MGYAVFLLAAARRYLNWSWHQRQLAGGIAVTATYVGSEGHFLLEPMATILAAIGLISLIRSI